MRSDVRSHLMNDYFPKFKVLPIYYVLVIEIKALFEKWHFIGVKIRSNHTEIHQYTKFSKHLNTSNTPNFHMSSVTFVLQIMARHGSWYECLLPLGWQLTLTKSGLYHLADFASRKSQIIYHYEHLLF